MSECFFFIFIFIFLIIIFFFSIPWIPVEYINRLDQAKEDYKAEIWAFSTTLWEIFSHGVKPTVKDVSICYI